MQNLLIIVVVLLFALLGWVGWVAGAGVSAKCCPPRPLVKEKQDFVTFLDFMLFEKPDFVMFGLLAGRVRQQLETMHSHSRHVVKTRVDVPTLHGRHGKTRSACNMGRSTNIFAIPRRRELKKQNKFK